ncbi:MAG: GAF domain-containing protein [Methylococcaceae bacterium]|nr:GAF domain-containing protein [Methylococcaceae bacterium]
MSEHRIIKQLEKLIEIGIALSSKMGTDQLLEMILYGAKSITHADGGTLYRIQDNSIKMEIVHSDSLKIWQGGNSGNPINIPPIPLYNEDGSANLANIVSYSYHKKTTVNVADVYAENDLFDFSGPKKFDELNNYHSTSFLTVPLNNHENDTIGILQLINAIDQNTGEAIAFDNVSHRFTEALASQAGMVLTKQHLIDDLESMFESLIKLIATAVDDKSPYTGGHCRRVPELTMMVADAADKTDKGYLKDFKMTEIDRYELKIAGWLHDCGKIITPEYVVDKATKLETIFDRLELVVTRFEVLKRDTKIKMLEAKIAHPEKAAELEKAYQQQMLHIEDDLAFVKKANTGGEFMTDEDKERVYEIGSKIWEREGEVIAFLSEDETKNLTIERGTLTPEERQVINHHIEATIAMLEQIKFPKHLKRVPEYAGGHHERMDGNGYPNGLTREQMSIQARTMAIADIFEALTASDRPYKSGKKLSQSLFILGKMKEENHIDPDLYDAFMEKKVYLQYANKFLANFNITQESLDNMKNEGVDEEVINKLAMLLDTPIKGEDNFIEQLKQHIGLRPMLQYKETLLKHGRSEHQDQIDID